MSPGARGLISAAARTLPSRAARNARRWIATDAAPSGSSAGSAAGRGGGGGAAAGGGSGGGRALPALLAAVVAFGAGYALSSRKVAASASAVPASSEAGPRKRINARHPEYNFEAALAELQKAFPKERISQEESELDTHGHSTWSYHPSHPHAVVVWPESVDDVVKIVKIAGKYKVPLVPFAGGTSLEAHFSAPNPDPEIDGRKSISIDFNLMDKILRFSEEDGDVTVQPGVRWEDLNEELKARGSKLFFPIDPGPSAAIGGMAACGCSGTNAVRYGTMKDNFVINLTVVLPSGEVITTRARSRKSSAGPDLTRLFLGSEGTLGIVVAATLRLAPLPNHSAVGVSAFPSSSHACAAARDLLANGIGVQCVELLDDVMLKCVNKANEADPQAIRHEEKPSLFIKFAGATQTHVDADEKLAGEIVQRHGGGSMRFANEPEEIERLWKARKVALWSALEYQPESEGPWRCWTTDVCVPLGQLPELIKRVKEDVDKTDMLAPLLGHVGDGNFHGLLIFKDGDTKQFKQAEEIVHRMVHHAQELGGTCSGEHGVGIGKIWALEGELGKGTVDLLKRVKLMLDGESMIMNPGKLIEV